MLGGPEVAAALADAGFTDVVWIPDSYVGPWEAALLAEPRLRLIRVSREGEALLLAAGLLLGGRKPLVIIQCTGLFEAGDALRNVAFDLKLPVRLIVGVRSWLAARQGPTFDSCPRFMEPYLKAWDLPYHFLMRAEGSAFREALRKLDEPATASVLLIPE
jgi:sulfopyruvate decarboxylase TPP-binding subunit